MLLLLDGLVAIVVSAGLAWFSIFQPPAAVEGRAPIDQSEWALALGTFVYAIACFWAAQRALRGIRAGRVVGVVAAGIVVVLAGWVLVVLAGWVVFQNAGTDITALLIPAVFLAPQVLIIVALVRWSPGAALSVQGASAGTGV